jgi:hypothetical protein
MDYRTRDKIGRSVLKFLRDIIVVAAGVFCGYIIIVTYVTV